jgi:hypothetical protein
MNDQAITLVIPAGIAALPNVSLLERAALAFIHEHPHCRNAALARHLGISVRGVEALVHRLRALGHIRSAGRGRARHLTMTFPVENHTECGVQQPCQTPHKMRDGQEAPPAVKREMSACDYIEEHTACFETCIEYARYGPARRHLELIRDCVERGASLRPLTKAEWSRKLAAMEDRCFAFEAGAEIARNLPGRKQYELALTLCQATPEKLARFREMVETNGKLENALEILALPSSSASYGHHKIIRSS